MELAEVKRRLEEGSVLSLARGELDLMLDASEIVREDRTAIAGAIRTLKLGNRLLVQERTPKGAIYVRKLASEEAALRFVQSRLDAYERMWDG